VIIGEYPLCMASIATSAHSLSSNRLLRIETITTMAKFRRVQGGFRVVYLGKSLGVAPNRSHAAKRLVVAKALRFGKVI